MKYVYLNYMICWLILLIFYCVSARFLLTIKNRSRAAFHLGILLLFGAGAAFAFFISGCVFHPLAAMHRYFTIAFVMAASIHTAQFFLSFPTDDFPRFRRGLLLAEWLMLVLIVLVFISKSLKTNYIFYFNGHCWDFQLDALSKLVGLLMLLTMIISTLVGLFKAFTYRRRKGGWFIALVFLNLIVALVPGIINILSRDGIVGRDLYNISMIFFNMTGFFGMFIIFTNLTKDRTTFMAKIITVTLSTVLLLMLGITYYSSVRSERFYDGLHRLEVRSILNEKNYRPDELEYIAACSVASGRVDITFKDTDKVYPVLSSLKSEASSAAICQGIKNLKSGRSFKADLEKLLRYAGPFFEGYKKGISGFADRLSGEDPNVVKKVMEEIGRLNLAALKMRNKIAELPDEGFRPQLDKMLSANKDVKAMPFKEAISADLVKSRLQNHELKGEVLQFLSSVSLPEARRYRNDETDIMRKYISYMNFNPLTGIVYEVGFSYIRYRELLHPDARNLLFILAGLVFAVVFIFPYFFSGSLRNPLENLLNGVREIVHGNLEVNIPVQVQDEIGYLTHNFNNMAVTIKKSNEQIQDYANNLEQKVKDRTEELNAANEELEAMNDSLVKARDAIWGEMQLAKKIQTVLLPDKPEIKGFEIAAHMMPTDEVGGDYYDIINIHGYDWLVIGDVSGHGVPAGLIMMMVQTAIHTVLLGAPDSKPEFVLSRINTVITENIKRLGEDKYMTITVIACLENGRFYYSGLHQDIMIYRAKSKSVEIVETRGIWIGIMSDIESIVKDEHFILESGDVMLLYTDGITEAWGKGTPKDDSGKENIFGDERLKNSLARLGEKDPEAIKQGIMEELIDYEFADDITIVIVKKK